MADQNIFTVSNEQLGALDAEAAVDCFRELLWAEATALGIGKNLINVPGAIDTPDGGIDAEVRDVDTRGGQGIIKPGTTRYQIKTGDFRLTQASKINELLFTPASLRPGKTRDLHPRIKSCFEKDGTLVIVLFGWDQPETSDEQILSKIYEKLGEVDPAYRSAKIEIWRQNNIRSFLQPYPSLALRITGRQDLGFRTHAGWSTLPGMQDVFQPDCKQFEAISRLQGLLRADENSVHIRVLGEPGIGKTRLVFEALKPDDLGPLVVYCQSAAAFRHSQLMADLLRDDIQYSVILVVDECSTADSRDLWSQLQHTRPGIKLVTIYHNEERTTGPTVPINAPLLAPETIAKIIESHGVSALDTRRWAALCGGSPRVAHVIGANLRINPDDILREPDTTTVWERFIVGPDDPRSAGVPQRRLVLLHLALFQRFGFDGPVIGEAKQIAALIQAADLGITWPRFQQIIKELRDRRVLQGEHTLYITPKALHIWLWREWWDTYGVGFNLEEFEKNLSPKLRAWFQEMFAYARESDAARRVVRGLLGPGGAFEKFDYLRSEAHGPRFFRALTEADPQSALQFLQRTIGRWTDEELLSFTTGRQEIIWALERIAVWHDLFQDAARVLLALAGNEDRSALVDSASAFAKFFSLAPGATAPSEASPSERLPVLVEAIESASKAERLAALKAFEGALSFGDYVRDVGAEEQGLRAQPDMWVPRTYGEWFDAYRAVWRVLWEHTPALPEDEREEAIRILLSRAGGLARVYALAPLIREALAELAEQPYVDKHQVLSTVISIRRWNAKNVPESPHGDWERLEVEWELLEKALTGNDFPSLLRRFVGMDLLQDKFDEEGKRNDRAQPNIEVLAEQAIAKPELLDTELPWLLSGQAVNAGRFGYALGRREDGLSLYPRLLAALRAAGPDGNGLLVGTYLRALFERDQARWEAELDTLAADADLRTIVPEFTLRADLTDRAARRLLDLAHAGVMRPSDFQMFGYSGLRSQISTDVFGSWIEFLLGSPDRAAAAVALQLCHVYYLDEADGAGIPTELAERLLFHESFLAPSEAPNRIPMVEYYWQEVARHLLDARPARGPAIASKILEHLGDDSALWRHEQEMLTVLNLAVSNHGAEVWPTIAQYLGPPVNRRAYRIKEWLSGGGFFGQRVPGALDKMPPDQVWAWVDSDPENRTWYIATVVPNVLFHNTARVCWARELLVRYGDRDDVRRNLAVNFSAGGWAGNESDYLREKRDSLTEYIREERHPQVRSWVNDFVARLDREIEEARIREERRGY